MYTVSLAIPYRGNTASFMGREREQNSGSLQYGRVSKNSSSNQCIQTQIEVRDHINEIMQHQRHTNVVEVIKLGHDGGIKIHELHANDIGG